MDTEGICGSTNLDDTVRLQSGKGEEWIREKLHESVYGWCSAPRLANWLYRKNRVTGHPLQPDSEGGGEEKQFQPESARE